MSEGKRSQPSYKNDEKFIVIQSGCVYTQQGLQALCESHAGWRIAGFPQSAEQMRHILLTYPVDLVIIDTGVSSLDMAALLALPRLAQGHIVLLTEAASDARNAVYRVAGFDWVIGKQETLSTLGERLNEAMRGGCYQRGDGKAECYHPQEREVLYRLLRGKRPMTIAAEMGISYRAVSRYKQSGLRRVGVKNLQEMVFNTSPHAGVNSH